MLCDLSRQHDQRVVWCYGLEPLKESYYPSKFRSHIHCGRRDIIVLVCHVISQDHARKQPFDFRGRKPSRQVTKLQSLVAIVTLGVKLDFSLPRDSARLLDQKVKWFYEWEFLLISHLSTKFSNYRHSGSRNIFLVVEEHYSTCPGSNPPLVFIAKSYGMSCSHTKNFGTYTQ